MPLTIYDFESELQDLIAKYINRDNHDDICHELYLAMQAVREAQELSKLED